MTDIASDLFDWAARRPPEKVVHFLEKRKSLPRWQAIRLKPLAGYDRAVAHQSGQLPPAPNAAGPACLMDIGRRRPSPARCALAA